MAEERLGVTIPSALVEQFKLRNGGFLADDHELPFRDKCERWGNAIVDRISEIGEWQRLDETGWFDHCGNDPSLKLMIGFAQCAESFLCLDYRECGAMGEPGIVYVEATWDPIFTAAIAKNADELISELIRCNGTK